MKKLRLRKVKYLAQGHTARKKQNQDLNSLETTLAILVNASLQGSLPSLSTPTPTPHPSVGGRVLVKMETRLCHFLDPLYCQEVPQLLDQSF